MTLCEVAGGAEALLSELHEVAVIAPLVGDEDRPVLGRHNLGRDFSPTDPWSVNRGRGGEGRVFASTTRKPHTAKKVSAYLSRVGSWRSATRAYDPAPDAQASNPQLVELTVAAIQPGDEAWAWAALAHELRTAASHHEEPLTLPLPLHLARRDGGVRAPAAGEGSVCWGVGSQASVPVGHRGPRAQSGRELLRCTQM